MNKKKLSQLKSLKEELKLIDDKLERLYERQEDIPVVMGKVTGSSHDFPYTQIRTSVLVSNPKESDEIKKQIAIKERRAHQVECLITEIEAFIEGIPDSKVRRIIELKYMDGKKLEDIGKAVGYTKGRVSQIISSIMED